MCVGVVVATAGGVATDDLGGGGSAGHGKTNYEFAVHGECVGLGAEYARSANKQGGGVV